MRFATGRGGDGTVVLVSMDGMRWQFIDSGHANTKNLNYLAQNGVKAKYIKTVVPSKTWPNHHSFLTGLYPESHGIVSNNFWDPVYQEKFVLDYDCSNYDPKFYNASEPIWLTLQKSGGRSGVYFWPGFAGYDEKPTFYEKPICYLNCNDVDPKKLPLMRNTTRSGWPPYIHCMVNQLKRELTRSSGGSSPKTLPGSWLCILKTLTALATIMGFLKSNIKRQWRKWIVTLLAT